MWSIVEVVQLARIGVALSLGAGGVRFLVSTISLQDVLLNTVALEFVLSIDDVIFATFAPRPLAHALEDAGELKVPEKLSMPAIKV